MKEMIKLVSMQKRIGVQHYDLGGSYAYDLPGHPIESEFYLDPSLIEKVTKDVMDYDLEEDEVEYEVEREKPLSWWRKFFLRQKPEKYTVKKKWRPTSYHEVGVLVVHLSNGDSITVKPDELLEQLQAEQIST